MTQHADAETRRIQVAEALLTTIAERGLARTTLTDVAATAGVSVGLVQRYFRSKDELLRFGFDHVCRRTRERVGRVPIVLPVRNVVIALMEQILPLEPEREKELGVWLSFVQASLTDTELAATHQASVTELIDGLTAAFEGAQRAGELPPGLDLRAEAAALAAFVDGLCLHHATTQSFDAARSRAALRTYVDRMFASGR
ncbi:transcriptional regulator [Actinorhabdospora filicis]|uniref:Transcriptional regulator n=1 Tax=Actinorhabdospora filicis TaxID=1785913 RepID=A0A9W6SM89_9ACTN|nr:TetR/AcrR family transcriptional regulator [Actinorhabdospora filicis]GLZ78828.1 transcriptional regulator [Actinorhabdospora filicis]